MLNDQNIKLIKYTKYQNNNIKYIVNHFYNNLFLRQKHQFFTYNELLNIIHHHLNYNKTIFNEKELYDLLIHCFAYVKNQYTLNQYCMNCGKTGHSNKICYQPIISCGLVVVHIDLDNSLKFMMVKRKFSPYFSEFIRGQYTNIEYLKCLIENMTIDEKSMCGTKTFNELYYMLYKTHTETSQKNIAEKKFTKLINGYIDNNEYISLATLLEHISAKWETTEWEFPKGKRQKDEDDFNCALREFEEETTISPHKFDILPFKTFEIYKAKNDKKYKLIYYIGITENIHLVQQQILENNKETSEVNWFTLEQAKDRIRYYKKEKIKILEYINAYFLKLLTYKETEQQLLQ